MNDASGLVSLKFAVAVAMGTMVFTVGGATMGISEGGDWRRAGRVCGELVVWPLDALPQPLGRG